MQLCNNTVHVNRRRVVDAGHNRAGTFLERKHKRKKKSEPMSYILKNKKRSGYRLNYKHATIFRLTRQSWSLHTSSPSAKSQTGRRRTHRQERLRPRAFRGAIFCMHVRGRSCLIRIGSLHVTFLQPKQHRHRHRLQQQEQQEQHHRLRIKHSLERRLALQGMSAWIYSPFSVLKKKKKR